MAQRRGRGFEKEIKITSSQTQTHKPDTRAARTGYVEVAYRTPNGTFHRNHFLAADDVEGFQAGFKRHAAAGDEVFRSIARYPGPRRCDNHRWPGSVIDVDCEGDLKTAQWASVQIAEALAKLWGIDPAVLRWSFSGAKGFHCVAPGIVLGPEGNRQTAAFWKQLARRLYDQYPQVDLSIYRSSALLRLNGSVHHQSGLYKVPLEYAELRDLPIDDILALAKSPREEAVWVDAETVPQAQRWLEDAIERFNQQHEQSERQQMPRPYVPGAGAGWKTPLCIRRIEEGAELVDGERHTVLFALAIWYRNTGMCAEEAVDRLFTLDAQHPIHDPDFIPRAVASAFQGRGFRGCPHEGLERFCNGGEGQCVLLHGEAAPGRIEPRQDSYEAMKAVRNQPDPT